DRPSGQRRPAPPRRTSRQEKLQKRSCVFSLPVGKLGCPDGRQCACPFLRSRPPPAYESRTAQRGQHLRPTAQQRAHVTLRTIGHGPLSDVAKRAGGGQNGSERSEPRIGRVQEVGLCCCPSGTTREPT